MDEDFLMGLARVTVFVLMLLNGARIPIRNLFSLVPPEKSIALNLLTIFSDA
jgi:hypothetical protein